MVVKDQFEGKDASEFERPRYFDEEPTVVGPLLPCKKCGKSHGTGVLDVKTNIHTPIDICSHCLWDAFEIAKAKAVMDRPFEFK